MSDDLFPFVIGVASGTLAGLHEPPRYESSYQATYPSAVHSVARPATGNRRVISRSEAAHLIASIRAATNGGGFI